MNVLACELRGVRGERVALANASVSVALHDLLAEVTMRQCYRNEEPVNIEAVYTFPLPLDAVLLELEVELGGRVLKGMVVEKKAAEERFEDAVAEGDAAVMLEQLEPGIYTMNVGNLLQGETLTVKFSYSILYRWVGEKLRISLPTTIADRYGDSPHEPHQTPESSLAVENHFSLQMEIFGSLRDAQFTCPSHPVSLSRLTDRVVVGFQQKQAAMDRDFVFNVKALKASRSFSICGGDGDGLAAVASFQPFFPGLHRLRPLNLAIVVDCSGSMQGDSIEQTRKALGGILEALQPFDRVGLIAFGSSTHALWDRLAPCTPANCEVARNFAQQLDANMGGTEIGRALQAAYQVLCDTGGAEILLVTDGEVSKWQPVVQDAKGPGHRIFTVGVGNAVSEAFVRELAARTGGACELVAPREDMAERIIRHFERMRAPRARRVLVHWPKGAADIAPSALGAVFDGDTVISSARFTNAAISGPVILEAETETGETVRQELPITMAPADAAPERISMVARFAASERLKELDRAEGLNTALRYRLVSSWTNWLVIAPRAVGYKTQEIPALRKVPQTRAAGMTILYDMEAAPPMASGALFRRAGIQRGRILYQPSLAEMSRPLDTRNSNETILVRSVSADEWHEIAQWALRTKHSDLWKESNEMWRLVHSGYAGELNETHVQRGLEILRMAYHLGFKLSQSILEEALRLGIKLGK
jgi:Ca-activated chloride channel family protein